MNTGLSVSTWTARAAMCLRGCEQANWGMEEQTRKQWIAKQEALVKEWDSEKQKQKEHLAACRAAAL